jgi:hypothetical protein
VVIQPLAYEVAYQTAFCVYQIMQQYYVLWASNMEQRIIYSRLWFYLNTVHPSNCEAAYRETTERNPRVVKTAVFKPPSFLSTLLFPLPNANKPVVLTDINGQCLYEANGETNAREKRWRGLQEGVQGGLIHMISSCGLSIDHLTRCHIQSQKPTIHYGPCPSPD